MADLSEVIGITFMTIGALFVVSGMILCYVTKGEYYNQDEVQAMVAAEVLEEEKKKKADAEAAELALKEDLEDEMYEGGMVTQKKKRVPLVAS